MSNSGAVSVDPLVCAAMKVAAIEIPTFFPLS